MNDYQPLSPKELERGYFFLSHKDLLKKIALAWFILVIALIYGLAIFNLIRLFRSPSWSSLATSISASRTDWSGFHKDRSPREIVVAAPQYISLGNRRYDLAAFVNNPNNDWALAEFEYNFVVNGQELAIQTSFLNPGEDRLIAKIGYLAPESIGSVQLNLGRMSWRRYSEDTPVIDWEIQNIKYQPVSRQTLGKESFVVPPRVSWEARNMSLYDFWEVGWQVVLLSGDKMVGVKESRAADWQSLQSQPMELVWLEDLPRVTKTLVYPALNWLDFDNYKNRPAD